MATSGYIQYGESSIMGKLSWTLQNSSAKTNTSTIVWKYERYNHKLKELMYSTNVDIVINNTPITLTYSSYTIPAGWSTVGTGTLTIQHDINGQKTFEYSFVDYSIVLIGGDNGKASGTSTLETIDRKAKILTASNFTDEDNPLITYINPALESVTLLQACIANSKGNQIYVPYRDISKTGLKYSFNLTIEERNTLRAAATGSSLAVRFYIKSEIDGITSYSFLDRTMTLDDIEPTFNPIVRDNDAVIVGLTGDNSKIILGYSDIYYDIGVTAPAGTSIITQSIKCGSQHSDTNSGTFADVDTNIVEFSATDSRGNVANTSIEMDVIPYIKVTCNQTVRLNLDSTVALTIKGNYFSDSFGAQNNDLKIEHRSREVGGEWSEWGDITITLDEANSGTYTLTTSMSGFDASGTYEFQARASDKLSSAESAISSVTLKPIFDWGKYDFNFNVPLTIEGYPLDDYVIDTGTEAMGTNGTWYWSKWKSGKAECYGCRNYGNMAITTDWGGWFRSGSFSQDLPYGLFAATPEVIDINLRQGSSGGWVVRYEYEAPTADTTGSFIVVRPKSATISQAYISFNVIGRWK